MAAQASIARMAGRTDRAAAAAAIVQRGDVIELANGAGWIVVDRASGSGKGHAATATTCDCPDARFRSKTCKHQLAVRARLGITTCQTCGAPCEREAVRIGGRGLVSFNICTADRTHRAQPTD